MYTMLSITKPMRSSPVKEVSKIMTTGIIG